MRRSIFLVANKKSEEMCANLIYSIRGSGCRLPIELVHFGGKPITSQDILSEVTFLRESDFSSEARGFIDQLHKVITFCPRGFLYRFLAFFYDHDSFIYSDNDIVALCNWERLFGFLDGNDLVHADLEYTTEGKFNYRKPEVVKEIFGVDALESAITAGHIVMRKNPKFIEDFYKAMDWFEAHEGVPVKHDQALLHIASLLGNWKIKNLCKDDNWLSSWAGHFENDLEIIQKIQEGRPISHLHYSGGTPSGNAPVDDLLNSYLDRKTRTLKLVSSGLKELTGLSMLFSYHQRGKRKLKGMISNVTKRQE